MAAQNADAALLTLYENRRYYSGFTGSNGVLIVSGGGLVLVTDRRYTRQAEEQTQGVRIVEHAADRYTLVAGEIKALAARSLLIESNMPVAEYLALGALLPGIPMIPAGDALLDLRMVKDEAEIANIRTAICLSEQALAEVAAQCKTGMNTPPTMEPIMPPRPPLSDVPPMQAAVTEGITQSAPTVGCAVPSRQVIMMPAIAAVTAERPYTSEVTLAVLIPAISAAYWLPPTA